MNEVIVCVREWRDQETSIDTFYALSPFLGNTIKKRLQCNDVKGATAIALEHGTKLTPEIILDQVRY